MLPGLHLVVDELLHWDHLLRDGLGDGLGDGLRDGLRDGLVEGLGRHGRMGGGWRAHEYV